MNKSLVLCAIEQNFLKDCSLLQCGRMGVLQAFANWKQKDEKVIVLGETHVPALNIEMFLPIHLETQTKRKHSSWRDYPGCSSG